jgi:hypothetical protein
MNTCQADSDKMLIPYYQLEVFLQFLKFIPCDVSASSSRKRVGQ